MTNFDPKAIEVSLAVKGTVESTAQGVFIGAVKDMPTVALVDDIIVLYVGEGDEYENGRFYQYDIQSDSWEVLSVNAQDFGLTPGTVVVADEQGNLKSSAITEQTLGYIANVTSDVQEQLDELGSGVTSAERRIDALETNLTGVTDRVTTVEEEVSQVKEGIGSISDRVAAVEGDVSSLESRMDTAESDIDAVESGLAGKQDAITGGATSILTDDLTADRALVSDAEGKVAVSNVTSAEVGYLSGATSNIQSQIDALREYAEALGGFHVSVVESLPESGESHTLYFVPSDDPEEGDISVEYMWIDGAWERVGSSQFKLTIAQDASGITINNTSLQTANASRTGLMPAPYVTAVDEAQEDITALEGDVQSVREQVQGIEGRVEQAETDIGDLQDEVITGGTLTDDEDGNLELTLNKSGGESIIIKSDVSTVVPVVSITISGTLSGETGGTLTLIAEVSPENATNKAVSWNITDGSEHVSIQSQTGSSCTISLVSAGSAVITATAQDGSGISQTATVTVTDPVVLVTAISISGDNSGDVGETVTLTAAVTPSNATNRAVTWAVTSGASYAVIASQTDSSCTVRLTGAGSAVITATAQDGGGATATHTIAVSEPFVEVTAISISGDTSGDIGTYITLTATVTPPNATNPAVTWSVTAGTGYIAITQQTATSCTVYCQAEGTGTVTATAQDGSGVTATHTIQSIDPTVYVTGIEITGDASGEVGGTISLSATVTPSNATNPAVTWAVSDGEEYISIQSQTGNSCTVSLDAVGSGTVTATAQDGSDVSDSITITVISAVTGIQVNYDSETILTDPTGCLSYLAPSNLRPVVNTSTFLARASDEGSWAFSESTGFNMVGMFYATFQSGSSGQYLHELLNPYDLTKYIAVWNDSSKSWDYSQTGNSHITTENTMLCIPTTSFLITGNTCTLGFSRTVLSVSAKAHKIDEEIYEYLGIGVYLGYNDGSVLKSISGVTASRSTTAADFRTYAHANTVRNGWAGVWNYYQYTLWKVLTYTMLKSFNGQARLGNGGLSYSASTTGLCDKLGPFAGNVSGTTDAVKCLIENPWGSLYQFVDDAYCSGTTGELMVGWNSVPTSDTSNKDTTISYSTSAGYGGHVTWVDLPSSEGWGAFMPADSQGSSTTGTCDRVYPVYSSGPFLVVGYGSGNVSNGHAGPGAVHYWNGASNTYGGARLAFVFNLRAPSSARAYTDSRINRDPKGSRLPFLESVLMRSMIYQIPHPSIVRDSENRG